MDSIMAMEKPGHLTKHDGGGACAYCLTSQRKLSKIVRPEIVNGYAIVVLKRVGLSAWSGTSVRKSSMEEATIKRPGQPSNMWAG